MSPHIVDMDRRTFNTTLLGGAVAAALPFPAAAQAAKATKTGPLYAWAVAIARAQNRASPALLAQQLRISQAAATELYASMIANGVIRVPVLGGMARAAKPLFSGGHLMAADASLSRTASVKLEDMKRAFDRVVEDAPTLDASEDHQAT